MHPENSLKNTTLHFIVMTTMLALFSQSSDAEVLRGPVFSDPAVLAVVPKEWSAKKIKYKSAHKDADLVLALGQQSHPIFHKLIQQYAKDHNLKIAITQGTCGITAGKLLRKKVDLGAYCCAPGRTDRLPGLQFHSLGISPIAIIVHPGNPITDITLAEARRIFRGQVTRWSEVKPKKLNALNQLIQPVGRLHCKNRPGHWRGLLKNEDLFSLAIFEVGVIPDMISQVAKNPLSIGYEVPLMVSHHKNKGTARMLKINGHTATDMDYVLAGQYPVYRTYHLATWTEDNKKNRLARKLVKFMRDHIEKIHQKIGFIPPSKLKKAGWKFHGEELIGEPDRKSEKSH